MPEGHVEAFTTPFVAQLFGESEDHWLLKVGKNKDVEFELDEQDPALNRFFVIYFRKEPPDG